MNKGPVLLARAGSLSMGSLLLLAQVALALRVTSEAAAMDELEQELSKLLEMNVVGGVVSAGGTNKALSQAEATSYRYWVRHQRCMRKLASTRGQLGLS